MKDSQSLYCLFFIFRPHGCPGCERESLGAMIGGILGGNRVFWIEIPTQADQGIPEGYLGNLSLVFMDSPIAQCISDTNRVMW